MKLRDEYLYWQSVKLAHPYGRKGHLEGSKVEGSPPYLGGAIPRGVSVRSTYRLLKFSV